MTKFKISETVACYVTWECVIEATSEDEAREKFINGERGNSESEPLIGDSIEFIPQSLDIERAES